MPCIAYIKKPVLDIYTCKKQRKMNPFSGYLTAAQLRKLINKILAKL